jgi:hypothetical protein
MDGAPEGREEGRVSVLEDDAAARRTPLVTRAEALESIPDTERFRQHERTSRTR